MEVGVIILSDKNNCKDKVDSDIELSNKSDYSRSQLSNKKVFVEINEVASLFIYDYAKSDTTQEMGGVLLGDYIEKDGHYIIIISAAIEARFTEAAKGSVKFTHETWAYINKIKNSSHPEKIIVGWFHTHPGFGIFLSEYDIFIHQNFFNLPWQIAYVVDPLSGKHGFFGWEGDSIEKVPFKASLEPYPVSLEDTRDTVSPGSEKKSYRFERISAVISITLFVFISGFFYMTNLEWRSRNEQLVNTIAKMEHSIKEMDKEIMLLEENNSELSTIIDNIIHLTPLLEYTIVEGDTLWAISERYLGNGHLYKDIADLNRITYPDLLIPGDKLLIPSDKLSK